MLETAQTRMNTGFLPVHKAPGTGLILFVFTRYSQENNPKRTSKAALLNDEFSRAALLVLFIFPPRDIVLAFTG